MKSPSQKYHWRENYHTFDPWDKLSISTGHEVFLLTQSAPFICVSVLFLIQVTKQELIYVCFLNIDCTYLYKLDKDGEDYSFYFHLGLIPAVSHLKLFLVMVTSPSSIDVITCDAGMFLGAGKLHVKPLGMSKWVWKSCIVTGWLFRDNPWIRNWR